MHELDYVLKHYGVKGMRWGINRDRNRPGGADGKPDKRDKRKKNELSPEVSKAKTELAKRKSEYKVANRQFNKESVWRVPSKETTKRLEDTTRELRYAKEDLTSAKILSKIKSKPNTANRIKMTDKYKKQGMSSDEAAVAAYKYDRFKKIATTVGITALTVGAAYATYKFRGARVDKLIKSGTILQNVASDSNRGVRDAFYSAKNALDKSKYKGMYGRHLRTQDGKAYVKQIKTLTDIKMASPKNAKKTLNELFKNDPDFAEGLKQYMKNVEGLGDVYTKKATRSVGKLDRGVVNKDIYETFNAALVDHSPSMQKLTNKYYDALAKKGYNAIKDVNDAKYSGYKSLNPIIAFNTKGKVNVVDVRELTAKEVKKHGDIAYAHIIGSEVAKQGAIAVASFTGAGAVTGRLADIKRAKRVTKYREINPNTKLTNTEIIRKLERGA